MGFDFGEAAENVRDDKSETVLFQGSGRPASRTSGARDLPENRNIRNRKLFKLALDGIRPSRRPGLDVSDLHDPVPFVGQPDLCGHFGRNLGRLFEELKHRPIWIVRKRFNLPPES